MSGFSQTLTRKEDTRIFLQNLIPTKRENLQKKASQNDGKKERSSLIHEIAFLIL